MVVDQVSIKVESRNLNGGDVLVMLASGDTKKSMSHMEGKIMQAFAFSIYIILRQKVRFFSQLNLYLGLGLVDVKEFQNANNLVLSIHLIGETREQQTRLFEKNILSKDEFPMDLKVTLKVNIHLFFYYCFNVNVN